MLTCATLVTSSVIVVLYNNRYGFMRDKSRSVPVTLTFALFHNVLQVFILPSRFFFTHVLMAVLLNSAFRGLSRQVTSRPPSSSYFFVNSRNTEGDVPTTLRIWGRKYHHQCSSRVGSKLPLPLYADVRTIMTGQHGTRGTDTTTWKQSLSTSQSCLHPLEKPCPATLS